MALRATQLKVGEGIAQASRHVENLPQRLPRPCHVEPGRRARQRRLPGIRRGPVGGAPGLALIQAPSSRRSRAHLRRFCCKRGERLAESIVLPRRSAERIAPEVGPSEGEDGEVTNATADAHKGEELEHRPYALGVGGTEEDDKLVRAGEEDWEQRKLLIDRLRLVEARLVCRCGHAGRRGGA